MNLILTDIEYIESACKDLSLSLLKNLFWPESLLEDAEETSQVCVLRDHSHC